MVFEAAVFAILLGLVLHGSLKNLAGLRLKWLWLILVSLAFSLAARINLSPVPAALRTPASYAACALRYSALLAFVFVNHKKAALLPVGLGAFLNLLVSMANGGKMPVALRASASGNLAVLLRKGLLLNYRPISAGTRLSFLCDCIPLRGFSSYLVSAGDLVLALGVFAFLLLAMEPAALCALRRRRMPRS